MYISSELGSNVENIPSSILGLFKKGKRVVFPFPGSTKESMLFIKDAFNNMLSGEKRGNVVLVLGQ